MNQIRYHKTNRGLKSLSGRIVTSTVMALCLCALIEGAVASDFEPPAFEQGLVLLSRQSYGPAIDQFSKALAENPQHWQSYFRRGVARSNLGQHREAIEDYTKAIELHPGDATCYFYRSYAYSRVRDGVLGLQDADQALKLGCTDPLLLFARALALQTLGRFNEALSDALSYQSSSNAFDAHQLLAEIYWDLGRYRDTIYEANKLLELNKADASPYLTLGDAYECLHDIDTARTNYLTYLSLVPAASANLQSMSGRARALNNLGRHKEALEDARLALSRNPDEFARNMLRFQMGWALVGLGRYGEAVRDLDEFLRWRPDYNLALRQRSVAHMKLGNAQAAVTDARAAVTAYKRSFEGRLQLARALVCAGQFAEAIEAVNPALAMRPSSVEALQLRADSYRQLHRDSDAEADLEDIARIMKASGAATSTPVAVNATDNQKRPIKDKWALVVGVSRFKDPSLNLRFPAKDASDFRQYLISDGHFAADHVRLLTDEQATRTNILTTLGDKWLPRVANPDDLVVIYLSSHGSPAEADLGGVNYLVAHDTSPDELYATGIPLQDLARIIKKRVNCGRIVIILDACHSGAADPSAKGMFVSSNVRADRIAEGTGQLVISSSEPDQQSWEFRSKPNSVFTHHLIDGLKIQGSMTTLKAAFEYLKEKVRADVLAERGRLQVPVLKSQWQGDDLIIGAPPADPRKSPVLMVPNPGAEAI